MGQRSQIYIRYNEGKNIVAYHLQWNWGEHMINRAYQLLDYISKNANGRFSELLSSGYDLGKSYGKEFLSALIQMNLELGSYVKGIDLVKEQYDWDLYDKKMIIDTFKINPNNQDNNDGFLVVDITEKTNKNGKIIPTIYVSIWDGEYKQVTFKEYAEEYKENAINYYKDCLTQGRINKKEYEETIKIWDKIMKKAQKLDKKYKTIDDERYNEIFEAEYRYEDNLSDKDITYLNVLNERRKKGV